jgi:hypothetical protein
MGADSLISIPPKDFPTALLAFFRGGSLVVAFCLLARVLDMPTLTPVEGSLSASPRRGWAETRMAGSGYCPQIQGWVK